MAEWLYEAGIGENRAALVENGEIVAAGIEPFDNGPRAGSVMNARFEGSAVGRRSAYVKLDRGGEAMLDPVPDRIGPGSRFTVEVVREWIMTPVSKVPKVRLVPSDTPLGDGPTLLERIEASGKPVRRVRAFEPDLLEEAGWSELIEEAQSGKVKFPGGSLDIQIAAAMTLIDVNGVIEPPFLAVEGAKAAARAINRLGLAGSIGVDLPTVADRSVRKCAAEALDRIIREPFERTAVNGFGFVQIVMRQRRPSMMHQAGHVGSPHRAAMDLLRRAERDPFAGGVRLISNHDVGTHVARWASELERRRGSPVDRRIENFIPASAAYLERIIEMNDDEEV